MKNFYEHLEVGRDVTSEELLQAYRRKIKETHPDMGGDTLEFLNIQKGYRILSNPETRRRYDAWLADKEASREHLRKKTLNYDNLKWVMNGMLLKSGLTDYMLFSKVMESAKQNSNYYKLINVSDSLITAAAKVVTAITSDLIINGNYQPIQNAIRLHKYCIDMMTCEGKGGRNGVETKHNPTKKTSGMPADRPKYSKVFVIGSFCIAMSIVAVFFINWSHPKHVVEKTPLELLDYSAADDELYPNVSINDANDVANKMEEYDGDVIYDDSHINNLPFAGKSQNDNAPKTARIDNEVFFENGDMPYRDYYGSGEYDYSSLSELALVNHSAMDAVVLLCADQVIRNAFVKKGNNVTLKNIPAKSCIVKIMFGNRRDSEKDNGSSYPKGGFVYDTSYSKTDWNKAFVFFPEETVDGINYPTYSLTLHAVKNGNLNTNRISKDEFF